jgi:bleomycin hydrolase
MKRKACYAAGCLTAVVCCFVGICLYTSCPGREHFTIEVLNSYTPVKQQGSSQTCWVYAMLSAIETEHIMKGDSVELSAAWVERKIEGDTLAPSSKRGTALTLITMIEKYGLVPHYAMRTTEDIPPQWAFLLGAKYTPLEFAHSVCAPQEYIGIGSTTETAPYTYYIFNSADNWLRQQLLNLPPDSLLAVTERAVRTHHGVCWEGDISERGFRWQRGVARPWLYSGSTTDDHCMAIVGLAHDEKGENYFIMKNSWGTQNDRQGLLYMSYTYFQEKTLAVVLPRACVSPNGR